MFGFWFSIIGLVFGVVCSLKAREKNRASQEWFILGFIFSFLAYIVISLLPAEGPTEQNNDVIHPDEDLSFSELIY